MSSARHAKPRTSRFAAVVPPVVAAPVSAGAPGGRHRAAPARNGVPSPAVVGAAAAAVAAGVVAVPTVGNSPRSTAVAAPSAEEMVTSVAEALTGVTRGGTDDELQGGSPRATSTDLARPVLPLAEIAAGRSAAAERSDRGTTRTPLPAAQEARAAAADSVAQSVAQAGAQAAAPSSGSFTDADVTAARQRAKSLLDARVAEIAQAAERAAAAAVPEALDRRGCGYNPRAQKRPDLASDQMRNVRTIIEVAQEMGLPPRAAVVALATAQQESWLKNLSWGDRDSLGLFQQRPSMGWGSSSQIRDPQYAARAFYRALGDVRGWQNLPLTVAAQRVQRSAFPSAYARWELMAAKLVHNEVGAPADKLGCRAG